MLEYMFEGRESPACANDLKSMPGYGKICSEILLGFGTVTVFDRCYVAQHGMKIKDQRRTNKQLDDHVRGSE